MSARCPTAMRPELGSRMVSAGYSVAPRRASKGESPAYGKSSAAIAEIIGISTATVDEHVGEACRKLGVRTRNQAAVEATLAGLID
jgi:hypothetical protein